MPPTSPEGQENPMMAVQLDLALQRLQDGEIDAALTLSEHYGLTLPRARLRSALKAHLATCSGLQGVQALAERAGVKLSARMLLERGRTLQKEGELIAALDFLQAGGADQAELSTLASDCAARDYPFCPAQCLALLQATGSADDLVRFGEHLLRKEGLHTRSQAEQAYAAAGQPVPSQLIVEAATNSLKRTSYGAIDDAVAALDACEAVGAVLPAPSLDAFAQQALDAGELENGLLLLSAAGRRPTEEEFRRCALGAVRSSWDPAGHVRQICRIGGVPLPVEALRARAVKSLKNRFLDEGLRTFRLLGEAPDREALMECARLSAGREARCERQYGRFQYSGKDLVEDLNTIVRALRAAGALSEIAAFSKAYERSGNRWAAERLVELASKPIQSVTDSTIDEAGVEEAGSKETDVRPPSQDAAPSDAGDAPAEDGSSFAGRVRAQLEALQVVPSPQHDHRAQVDAALASLPPPFEPALLARLDRHGRVQEILAGRIADGKLLPHPRTTQIEKPSKPWESRFVPVDWGYEVLGDTRELVVALIATGADRRLVRSALLEAADFFQGTVYSKPYGSEDGSCTCSFLSSLAQIANSVGMPGLAGSWCWARCGSFGSDRMTDTKVRVEEHSLAASRLLMEQLALNGLLRMRKKG